MAGYKSFLAVPLIHKGEAIGVLTVTKQVSGGFNPRQIELVSSFADQAVIAVENARLFEQVQAKTNDLEEALDQQTATANVLKVISRSAFDLQTVLDTLVLTGVRLSDGLRGSIFLRRGDILEAASSPLSTPELLALLQEKPLIADMSTRVGQAFVTKSIIHFKSDGSDVPVSRQDTQRAAGYNSMIAIPLVANDEAIGVFSITKLEAGGFTTRQIDLAKTFADQAVIAIGNARLFEEVQARTRDLTDALEQQTATADVLKVISRSAFDLQKVLDTLINTGVRLAGATHGLVFLRRGDSLEVGACSSNVNETLLSLLRDKPLAADMSSRTGRALVTKSVVPFFV